MVIPTPTSKRGRPGTRFGAERCRRHLREYMETAWPILEPATPFVPGFHLDAIAEHLEAITRRQIRKLLINIPQRHMKSPGLAGHQ